MHWVLVDDDTGSGPAAAPEDSVFQAAFLMEENHRNPIVIRRAGVPVGILTEDDIVAKVLACMKDAEAGPVLEALATRGAAQAKRTAAISERLRRALTPVEKARPL